MDIFSTGLDYVKAKAFTVWVKNQIGSEPTIRTFTYTAPNGSQKQILEIVWTEDQKSDMIKWLDGQVGGFFKKDEPGTIQMNFGDILLPWSLRYLLPTGIAIFILGRLTKRIK